MTCSIAQDASQGSVTLHITGFKLPNSTTFFFRFYQACTLERLIATERFVPILKQENFFQARFSLNFVSVSVDGRLKLLFF